MSFHAIGDRDTVLGFRLVGGRGTVPEGPDQAASALSDALNDPSLQVVFITSPLADGIRERVDRLKMTRLRPLVMEIPGRGGEAPASSIGRMVRQAIGINV